MAVNILLKRSATASKRPVGASMAFGELNLNYDASTGGLYYKNSAGGVVKVGPCQVSATAPNSTPAGSSGNSAGEFWFDTSTQTLKLYDGTTWVEAGGMVQGITGTAPITVDNTDPLNPIVGISTGTTSARGAVQLTDSTSSTSTTTAATPNSVKSAYDLANAALPKAGGTMTGDITFHAGQVFPGVVTSVTAVGGSAISVDNTDPTQPVLSVASASTTSSGVVQLNDTTSSSSTTEALTANQGRVLQTQIDALIVSNNLTFAGTIDASTGDMLTVSTEGSTHGFVIGDPLPSPAAGNSEFFVIVTVPGTMTPPGGVATDCHQGDWWLSDGTDWNFLDVGYNAPYATTTTPGIVQLATDAEVQAGSNLDHAVTPAGLQSKVSNSTSTTSSTTLASSTAVKSAYDAGIQGQTDAAAAQATADAALPKAGGTMTGNITFQDAGEGVVFNGGSSIYAISDSTSTTSSTTAASSTAVKAAYDLADAAVPDSSFVNAGDLLVGTGTGTYTNLPDGAAGYILQSNGDGTLSWVSNSTGDVTSISGTSPITVDNTNPQTPVVGINAASTTAAGAVQLNNTVTSTSTTEAATAAAVKVAYDTAVAAAAGNVNGITSDTVIFVNCTDGNDSTGQRGTTKPFLTITAALAAAQENDTIFLSPGTFTENATLTKGVNLVGTLTDQALGAGTKILGNFVVNATASMTKNWAIRDVYFISPNSTPAFSITANSFGAGGIGSVTNCDFTQATSSDPTQYAVVTSGTWSRSVYFRECTFDGNFHHNAGTAAGASGYVVIDRLLGVGNSQFYNRVATGTVEFRNPSNTLASVFQTGGVVLINGAASGITASGTGLNSVFGSSGFSYKGSAASVGTGTVYFSGESQGTGKVDLGANLIYGYTNLIMDPANLTVSGSAVAYTTAVPSAANAQTMSQQRPRLDLLKSTSSVTAANQLATVVDSSTGAVYTVAAMDAGTY